MLRQCGHCGRQGTLARVQDVRLSSRPTTVTYSNGMAEEDTTVSVILQIERCTVCEGPTFSTYSFIDGWSDPEDDFDFQQIFPELKSVNDLPSRIAGRYASMLEMRHAPDAFAVRAGKLLEALCADQGITRGDLAPRLDELVSGGRVPQALADQAHLVRTYRNIGGHDSDIEVEDRDVPLIRGFVEALLGFLYWGPASLARGRVALEQRRSRTTREDDGR